jgi:hypothetical protein
MAGERRLRTSRPHDQLAAAVRAFAAQPSVGAVRAERAFEGTDSGFGRRGRQRDIAALATRSQLEQGILLRREFGC